MARKYLIAGNWKMNKTAAEAVDLAQEIETHVGDQSAVDVCLCPPFTALSSVGNVISDSNLALGAQNLYAQPSGAYTGEIAPGMLTDLGCTHVIVGHSERREYFQEEETIINAKVLSAIQNKLVPILCVGELLEQREAGKTIDIVSMQVRGCLKGVKIDSPDQLVIAYEPVWAIGTGKVATPEMAQEVHAMIRKDLKKDLGDEIGEGIRILYGGSMKPENAAELLEQEDIDGGLIGGASLKADSFCKLVELAQNATA